jgi:pentapeptide MXKDX repeat protein
MRSTPAGGARFTGARTIFCAAYVARVTNFPLGHARALGIQFLPIGTRLLRNAPRAVRPAYPYRLHKESLVMKKLLTLLFAAALALSLSSASFAQDSTAMDKKEDKKEMKKDEKAEKKMAKKDKKKKMDKKEDMKKDEMKKDDKGEMK